MTEEQENTEEVDEYLEDGDFSELERRYFIVLCLTDDLDSGTLQKELDFIAEKLEEEAPDGDEQFYQFENKLISLYKGRTDLALFDNFPENTPQVHSIKQRLTLQLLVARAEQDEIGQDEVISFVRRIAQILISDEPSALEEAEEYLEVREDAFMELYYPDEEFEEDYDN